MDGNGRTGAAEITGNTAGWIDCSGPVIPDHAAGIAVFQAPDIDPYPWQVADYGTITINPFGTRGCPISRNEHTDQTIRIVVHDGDAESVGIDDLYKAFVS